MIFLLTAPAMLALEMARPLFEQVDDRQQNKGKGELHVGKPHDDLVAQTSAHPCESSEADAHNTCEQDGGEADEDRCSRADNDAAQDIPPKLVGSKHRQAARGAAASAPPMWEFFTFPAP